MAYANPLSITLPPDSDCTFSAISNAAYYQRITLNDSNGSQVAQFNGQGEGIQMLSDGSPYYATGTRGQIHLTAYFEYSPDGNTYSAASVVINVSTPTGDGSVQIVGTEDANDGDDNDTLMTLINKGL